MARFRVIGIDRETRQGRTAQVDAESAADAKVEAERDGMAVRRVEPVYGAGSGSVMPLAEWGGEAVPNYNRLAIAAAVVGALIAAAIGGFVVSDGLGMHDEGWIDRPAPGEAYFYDVVTREYFTRPATRIAPIRSPAGNEAVRAHFFSCGGCTDAERFLGYFEKYDERVKEKIEENPESMHFYEEVFQGRYYCRPDQDPTVAGSWVKAETTEGFDIAQALQSRCPARKLRYCPPPR